MKMLTALEIAHIVYSIASYMDIVHDNDLVLNGQVTAENVVVHLNTDLKVQTEHIHIIEQM